MLDLLAFLKALSVSFTTSKRIQQLEDDSILEYSIVLKYTGRPCS